MDTDLSVVVPLVDVGTLPEAQLGDSLVAVLSRHVQEGHSQVVLVVYRHRPVSLGSISGTTTESV